MKSFYQKNRVYGELSTEEKKDVLEIEKDVSTPIMSQTKLNRLLIKRYISDDIAIIAYTMNAILGVTIFEMSWGYFNSGLIGGTLMVIIVDVLSFETARILLVSQRLLFQRTGDVKGYPEIAALTMGSKIWSLIVQIATIISCLGVCIDSMIFLGETIGQSLSIPYLDSIYYVTIPLILLSWIRSFRNLSLFTIIGVFSIILAAFAIIYDGSSHMKGSLKSTPLFTSLPSTMKFLGPATFLFTIHYCALSVGSEILHERKHERELNASNEVYVTNEEEMQIEISVGIAYILSTIIISLLGAGGYVIYRQADIAKYDFSISLLIYYGNSISFMICSEILSESQNLLARIMCVKTLYSIYHLGH